MRDYVKEWNEREIKVWFEIDRRKTRCNMGHEHELITYGYKLLGPVSHFYSGMVHGSGQHKELPVRFDRQGRAYRQHENVDFYATTFWIRDVDNVRFHTSKPGWARTVAEGLQVTESVV